MFAATTPRRAPRYRRRRRRRAPAQRRRPPAQPGPRASRWHRRTSRCPNGSRLAATSRPDTALRHIDTVWADRDPAKATAVRRGGARGHLVGEHTGRRAAADPRPARIADLKSSGCGWPPRRWNPMLPPWSGLLGFGTDWLRVLQRPADASRRSSCGRNPDNDPDGALAYLPSYALVRLPARRARGPGSGGAAWRSTWWRAHRERHDRAGSSENGRRAGRGPDPPVLLSASGETEAAVKPEQPCTGRRRSICR